MQFLATFNLATQSLVSLGYAPANQAHNHMWSSVEDGCIHIHMVVEGAGAKHALVVAEGQMRAYIGAMIGFFKALAKCAKGQKKEPQRVCSARYATVHTMYGATPASI